MVSSNNPRMPLSVVAVVLILGVLGGGRSLFMVLSSWLAYQAGAADFKSYVFFLGHFTIGIAVLGVAVALARRARWAWVVAILTLLGMLIEESVRVVPLIPNVGENASLGLLASAVYLASMVVVIVLLVRKSSRNYYFLADHHA